MSAFTLKIPTNNATLNRVELPGMKKLLAIFALAATSLPVFSQRIVDRYASVIPVTGRQAELKSTTNPLVLSAIAGLHSCINTPFVPAPTGRMIIPRHYLNGSNGPINPAEAVATRIYFMFENRITSGMNQYLATGNHAESACALAQLDAWAQAQSLLNYDRDESSQAWFQVEWTLSSAGVTDSVLINDRTLDPAQQKRVTRWLDAAARKAISFERPTDTGNNHHDWRALAATSIGVTASDKKLFKFGIATYKEAIAEIDGNGAFPKEMVRHENATHYQGFTLQPLVMIAQFATRQHIDLYTYSANSHTLRDAILFFGRAIDDPSLIKPYTPETQAANYSPGDFAELNFYVTRFGTAGLPSSILNALQHPTTATRLGGSTTIMAVK